MQTKKATAPNRVLETEEGDENSEGKNQRPNKNRRARKVQRGKLFTAPRKRMKQCGNRVRCVSLAKIRGKPSVLVCNLTRLISECLCY